eukprot:2407009-Rhodomonas_salina.1
MGMVICPTSSTIVTVNIMIRTPPHHDAQARRDGSPLHWPRGQALQLPRLRLCVARARGLTGSNNLNLNAQ